MVSHFTKHQAHTIPVFSTSQRNIFNFHKPSALSLHFWDSLCITKLVLQTMPLYFYLGSEEWFKTNHISYIISNFYYFSICIDLVVVIHSFNVSSLWLMYKDMYACYTVQVWLRNCHNHNFKVLIILIWLRCLTKLYFPM